MSRARDVGALAACLAVVAAIAVGTGDREETVAVRYVDVELGATGVATDFDARVLDVTLAASVRTDETADPFVAADLSADAVLVLVAVATDARQDTVTFTDDVWLVTADGRRYAPRSELSRAQPQLVQPGFTATGTFVFAVPTAAVDGARLQLEPDVPLFVTYDITLDLDLGLDGGAAVEGGPVVLPPATIEVTP